MERIRINPVASPMQRDVLARQGGGRLFYLRRERDLACGLLSARGHGNDYPGVPSRQRYFVRIIGDRLLRLNEALSDVRGQGAELIPSVGGRQAASALRGTGPAHRGGPRPAGRPDRLLQQGLHGPFPGSPGGHCGGAPRCRDPTDESGEAGTTAGQPSDAVQAPAAAKVDGAAIFDALRQRHVNQGILTEYGRDQGCVAFQPSPFFGALHGRGCLFAQ